MANQQHGDMFAAYTTNIVVGSWHLDPDCAVMASGSTHAAHTLVELATTQAAKGRAPCRRCAYETILNALNAEPVGPGRHYMICGRGHSTGWDCVQVCPALTRYCAPHPGVLSTISGGRVALLLPGAIATPKRGDQTLTRMRLFGVSAGGKHLPVMNAASWATAAPLIGRNCTLAKALQVASALHAAPTLA